MPDRPASPAPDRLVVTPSVVAEAGHRLTALTAALASVAPHFRGPQAAPPLGEATCTAAYASAHHQLARLVTATVGVGRELAGSLTTAAALYAALDGAGREPGR
jgi:hypothetical protein